MIVSEYANRYSQLKGSIIHAESRMKAPLRMFYYNFKLLRRGNLTEVGKNWGEISKGTVLCKRTASTEFFKRSDDNQRTKYQLTILLTDLDVK